MSLAARADAAKKIVVGGAVVLAAVAVVYVVYRIYKAGAAVAEVAADAVDAAVGALTWDQQERAGALMVQLLDLQEQRDVQIRRFGRADPVVLAEIERISRELDALAAA